MNAVCRLIAAAAGLTVLAACKPAPAPVPEKAEGAEHVACAVAGAAEFRDVCAVERARAGDALFLVVRHPDGGFRRFEVLSDGRGIAAADGADSAQVALRDGGIEVTVDKDRYRFPATVRRHD